MKNLPIGIQNFETIIQDNYLYVDKTRQVHDLITKGILYFLSRPRRFGKTLLISTLKHIFQGKKDLFQGLYIAEETDYDWQEYSVLVFNFAKLGHKVVNLDKSLKQQIQLYADEFQLQLADKDLASQLVDLVIGIEKKHGKVVFLVDEYDKPIIDFIDDIKQANKNRETLRDFFAPLKDLEANGKLRFLFITGVSKFARVSIFSDLNNLRDLTIDLASKDVVGITRQELKHYFGSRMRDVSEQMELSEEELIEGLKQWYNGYSWDGKTSLYNPFSLLNFFTKNRFGNFWFATGTPTFLVKMIRDQRIKPKQLEEIEVGETFFDKFTINNLDIYALLFQTGYLTIKSTRRRNLRPLYKLGYPNQEVKESFIQNLLEAFTFKVNTVVSQALIKTETALYEGDVKGFVKQLKILFSDIAYQLLPRSKKKPTDKDKAKEFAAWEGYFHSIIYLITAFLGFNIQVELSKHKGRLDAVLQTAEFIYIMEFKLDETAVTAINQIKKQEYLNIYGNTSKKVLLVGIAFDKDDRNVVDWIVEEWDKEN